MCYMLYILQSKVCTKSEIISLGTDIVDKNRVW